MSPPCMPGPIASYMLDLERTSDLFHAAQAAAVYARDAAEITHAAAQAGEPAVVGRAANDALCAEHVCLSAAGKARQYAASVAAGAPRRGSSAPYRARELAYKAAAAGVDATRHAKIAWRIALHQPVGAAAAAAAAAAEPEPPEPVAP